MIHYYKTIAVTYTEGTTIVSPTALLYKENMIEINKDQLEMVTGGLGCETGPLGTELTGIRVKATGPPGENIDYPYMSRQGVRV